MSAATEHFQPLDIAPAKRATDTALQSCNLPVFSRLVNTLLYFSNPLSYAG